MALTTNLISYWLLDGNSNDSLGGNNGTDTSITYNAGNGKIVQGAGFSGGASFISFGSPANLDNIHTFTWSFWIKTASHTAEQMPISKDAKFVRVRADPGNEGRIELAVQTATTSANAYTSNILSNGTWYHIVMTYDNAGDRTPRIYINGSEATYTSQIAGVGTITDESAATLYFGQYTGAGGFRYDGALDEVGIWSRVLSGAEITELYNSGNGKAYPFGVAYTLALAVGTFTLTGVATTFTKAMRMTAAVGTFVLTGVAVGLSKGYRLVAEVGSYVLTGMAILFRVKTWINQDKSSSTWANGSNKNSSTWTNQDKS